MEEAVRYGKNAYMNTAIAAGNILFFIYLELIGSTEDSIFMIAHGAMFSPLILGEHQYSRLITSVFMHFGAGHLMNNMLILLILGEKLERILGHIKYLIFYFLCGIAANLVSMGIHCYLGEIVVGAGASGAIFGVVGGLVWAVARNRGRLEQLTGRQLGVMLVIVLYYGVSSSNIDNWAHLGGLASGILFGILMYRRPQKGRRT